MKAWLNVERGETRKIIRVDKIVMFLKMRVKHDKGINYDRKKYVGK